MSTNVLTLSIVSGQVVVYLNRRKNANALRVISTKARPKPNKERYVSMCDLLAIIAYPPSFPQLNSCAASQNCEVR